MQFLAARSRCTNFLLARYSMPLATCKPKPMRSFTVGFCRGNKKNGQPGKRFAVHTTRCVKAERTWLSSRMKLRRSPCFMYGSTTRGEPSLGRQIPSRDSTLGWLKSFMMIPSFRNCDTSSISVIPAIGTQHNFTT